MNFSLDATSIIIMFVSLVIGITLHEMMHAFTALKLGDTTAQEHGRISLNPLDHVDPFMTIVLPLLTIVVFGVPILAAKPVPFNPGRVKFDEFGAALVAAAGPLTNLALAGLGALLAHALGVTTAMYDALYIFVGLNIALFIFNLVPIPPLDGSRVLYAFAPDSVRDVMERLEFYGIFIVFGLVLAVPAFGHLLINLNDAVFQFLM